jgi:glycerol transport system ATP-binding protein
VYEFQPGDRLQAALDPDDLFVFDSTGRLVAAPQSM